MDEKNISQIRKNNMKIYPIYKMLGLDWLFYYGIRVLFLTQVKNIPAADIVLAGSFYAFFYIIFQISNMLLIEKIGKKRSIVLGQLLNLISMGIIIYCPNYTWLIVSQALCAMGFGLKGIAESNLLKVSIPKANNSGEIFTKIDSKGYSKFCFLGAFSVLLSGFLYAINPYIPIILCMIVNLIALIISTSFVDIEEIENSRQEKDLKNEIRDIFKDLKEGFEFIVHSKRLRALLIMLGILWGVIDVFATYQETLLKELSITPYYIGLILAGFQMLVGVFSTKSNAFNKKHKNYTLTYIGLMLTIGSIILGIATLLNIPFEIQLIIIIIIFILRAYAKGVYQVLKNRYMNNFANNTILPKIYSINGIMANVGKMVVGIFASTILKFTSIQNSLLVLGSLCTIIVIALFIYSKNKLGLNPKEYTEKDIGYKIVE